MCPFDILFKLFLLIFVTYELLLISIIFPFSNFRSLIQTFFKMASTEHLRNAGVVKKVHADLREQLRLGRDFDTVGGSFSFCIDLLINYIKVCK